MALEPSKKPKPIPWGYAKAEAKFDSTA